MLIGHGKKWNLITSGEYNYYELSNEIITGLTPNNPNHCLIPEIDKSYDKDLLLEIDEIYQKKTITDNPMIPPTIPEENIKYYVFIEPNNDSILCKTFNDTNVGVENPEDYGYTLYMIGINTNFDYEIDRIL